MPLQSVEASGNEMIELVRQLKQDGHHVWAVEVGKTNAAWIVEYYPKESEPQPQQSDLFGS